MTFFRVLLLGILLSDGVLIGDAVLRVHEGSGSDPHGRPTLSDRGVCIDPDGRQ